MVFQGVLRLYGFDWDKEWAEGEARESVIVFIGDNLPEARIRAASPRCRLRSRCARQLNVSEK